MSFAIYFLLLVPGITLLIYIGLIVCWLVNFKEDDVEKPNLINGEHQLPEIAILVAARNEEKNISRCLDALLRLHYPVEKIQILVGNDGSHDDTAAIVQNYTTVHPHISLIEIKEKVGKADAKANVLAHLIRANNNAYKKAGYYLITDADVTVNPEWAGSMLAVLLASKKNTGIVTGVTLIEGKKTWAKLQSLDWLLGLGMVKVLSDLSFPVTTMGNNMLVTKHAYDTTGGYEQMPFSVTEDFELFHAAIEKGFLFKNVISDKVLAWSQPVPSVGELLQQRKRWMYGAIRLPFFVVGLLWILAVFYPFTIILFWIYPLFAITIIVIKWILQGCFLYLVMNKLKFTKTGKFKFLTYFLLFEVYAALLMLCTIIFYFLPVKVKWKDRKF